MEMNLGSNLQHGLRGVAAPAELWDRVQSIRPSRRRALGRRLVWALAASVVLATLALSKLPGGRSQQMAFHCQNPAQLRAWVKANTGFNVPLRAALPASIQLIGARTVEGRVEIAYRAGNRDAMLLVSQADPGSVDLAHNRMTGKSSSWVMDGQRFTLACNDSADFQLACKLCHLD